VLIVGPAQLIATPQTGQDTQQTNVASLGTAAPPPPSPEQQKALGLHAKGQELLERGNIYPARMFFKRAAEAGLAQSALALAATYDPNELAKLKVVGLQPDVAAARHWYQKALELGAEEAKVRLRRLEDR
jgi:TPR repeat protein